MRILGSVIFIAFAALALQACGFLQKGSSLYDYIKVTGIEITPAKPQAGDLVQVRVLWDSNGNRPDGLGFGPSIHYLVSGGELIVEEYRSGIGPVEVRGQDITVKAEHAQWQLPTGVSAAWITAELPDGSQTLMLEF
jgi:hypothetical protein